MTKKKEEADGLRTAVASSEKRILVADRKADESKRKKKKVSSRTG